MNQTTPASAQRVEGHMPAYSRISDTLIREIRNQQWLPGSPLPNEKKLAERFGVSIGTVRRAVEHLSNLGLVSKRQGLGTFVSPQISVPPNNHNSPAPSPAPRPFNIKTSPTGNAPQAANVRTEVLALNERQASEVEAKALGVMRGSAVWEAQIRHWLGEQPVVLECLCLAQSVFPALTLAQLQACHGDLYLLAKGLFDTRILEVKDEVSVEPLDHHAAMLLNKDRSQPALRVLRVTRDVGHTTLEHREVWMDPAHAHYLSRSGVS
ncbi:MAG: GntR family transcriptional regulator [Limnobacter sp.]|uniref:GntR family transcriptional regulator n=1 Tax=Limnobacter sp. TaxID=2003368 RepID=UPI00391BAF91